MVTGSVWVKTCPTRGKRGLGVCQSRLSFRRLSLWLPMELGHAENHKPLEIGIVEEKCTKLEKCIEYICVLILCDITQLCH